jgi:gluconolactonase
VKPRIRSVAAACAVGALLAGALAAEPPQYPAVGRITSYDPSFGSIVAPDARIEKLTDGITWAEGPTWVRDSAGGHLEFSDPPKNRMYAWSERRDLESGPEPSGYAGPDDGTLREPGSNGLLAEGPDSLLMADSGSRNVARMDLHTGKKTVLADRYQGHRFNSPNDLVRRRDGAIFFTDPPYGLRGIERSPVRELTFSGVFRIDPDGSVHLIDDSLKFPNGVALSPDGNRLYVSNSDQMNPVWMVYALDARGEVKEKHVFADAGDLVRAREQGNPDGMCMAADGTLFSAAPGGLLVFNPDGKRLGRIETGVTVSNCTFGGDGYMLYMTSSTFIARVRVKVKGL